MVEKSTENPRIYYDTAELIQGHTDDINALTLRVQDLERTATEVERNKASKAEVAETKARWWQDVASSRMTILTSILSSAITAMAILIAAVAGSG